MNIAKVNTRPAAKLDPASILTLKKYTLTMVVIGVLREEIVLR